MNWQTKSHGPKKNVSISQEGGLTTVPPTQPVVRLVLLHKQANHTKVFELNCNFKVTAGFLTGKNINYLIPCILLIISGLMSKTKTPMITANIPTL